MDGSSTRMSSYSPSLVSNEISDLVLSPSVESNKSLSELVYSSLKSVKIGSSESPYSCWSDEKMPVVDEYKTYRLRELYINNTYDDEPVARVLFEPN